MVLTGMAPTLTFLPDVELHPAADVTVTLSVVVPAAPAVNVIAREPAPEVIVPFTMVQVYVAPAPASGVDAARPAEPTQAASGAVRVASGNALTATDAEPDELQPDEDTVIESVTGAMPVGVKAIARVPVPDVIEPFVIDQLYAAPAPASGTEAAPLPPAQSAAGAVIVAEGTGVTETLALPFALHAAPL